MIVAKTTTQFKKGKIYYLERGKKRPSVVPIASVSTQACLWEISKEKKKEQRNKKSVPRGLGVGEIYLRLRRLFHSGNQHVELQCSRKEKGLMKRNSGGRTRKRRIADIGKRRPEYKGGGRPPKAA